MKDVRVIDGLAADNLPISELIEEGEPAILKAVAADWPLVRKGLEGASAAIEYLSGFDAGKPVVGYVGKPEIGGRFFYNDEMTGLNFEARRVPFKDFLERIAGHLDRRRRPLLLHRLDRHRSLSPGPRQREWPVPDRRTIRRLPAGSRYLGRQPHRGQHAL